MPAPRILSIGTANPPNRFSQREVYELSARFFPMYRSPAIEHIFMSSDIDFRHFCIDRETFVPHESADELHARFAENAVPVARNAVLRCFENADGLDVSDIDCIVAVSCTGYLCPGLSALLIKDLGLRNDVQRADLVGMGCAGALPGLQRAFDYIMAYPEKKVLMVAVEICSACYYVDESLETVVGNAICGDGAAAVLMGNHDVRGGPRIIRFETLLDPAYIDTVGFQFRGGKLRIVLSKDIRGVAGDFAVRLVEQLLSREGLTKDDIRHWVIHSGGRKVIEGIRTRLSLSEGQMECSRNVLRNFGNMSSPTVLFVLQETMRQRQPAAGEYGILLALGPGLAVEGALVRW